MDVATLLVRTRERAGLTQRTLAEQAGTSAAAICLYESGKRVPRVDTLRRILAAAGATLQLDVERQPQDLDPAENAAALVAVLELAEHLPGRPGATLDAPIFAELAT